MSEELQIIDTFDGVPHLVLVRQKAEEPIEFGINRTLTFRRSEADQPGDPQVEVYVQGRHSDPSLGVGARFSTGGVVQVGSETFDQQAVGGTAEISVRTGRVSEETQKQIAAMVAAAAFSISARQERQ